MNILQLPLADVKMMFGAKHLNIEKFITAVIARNNIGNDNYLSTSTKPYLDKLKGVLTEYLSTNNKKR